MGSNTTNERKKEEQNRCNVQQAESADAEGVCIATERDDRTPILNTAEPPTRESKRSENSRRYNVIQMEQQPKNSETDKKQER